jgi:hypothetical protein
MHIPQPRGPPFREACDAQAGEGGQVEPERDLTGQPGPDYEISQRVNW